MSICKGCGAEIIWKKTSAGKSIPCDMPPVNFTPGGGPETFVTEAGKVERGKRDKGGEKRGYVSHFATCPCAGKFRRGKNDGK